MVKGDSIDAVCFANSFVVPFTHRGNSSHASKSLQPMRGNIFARASPIPFQRVIKTLFEFSPLGKMLRSAENDASVQLEKRQQSARAGAKRDREYVLVTGAAGGTGRRVVKLLLGNGKNVRALVRSLDKAKDILNGQGVDVDALLKEKRLEFAVGDLYNLRKEFFNDVGAVVSCTGTRVGPPDDPDRSKYFQGIKFYPPNILEDNPENVEYVGIKALAERVAKYLPSSRETDDPHLLELFDFSSSDKASAQWTQLDDIVMGGVSSSRASVSSDNSLVFSGNLSTDNFGGFASIRTLPFRAPMNIKGFDGITFRAKGDGKNYKFVLRCDNRWDGVTHCYTFPTTQGVWTTVRILFTELRPVFRAKTVTGSKLDLSTVSSLQIMLSKFEYDGELNPNFSPGPFELAIKSLCAYKGEAQLKAPCPRLVHIGSAGSTRVLRKGEFDIETQPPAVKLNDQLGRIMEWKLAGEDAIRASKVPYCIVRPCALTEEEAVGVDSLEISQGDTLTGQVPRDDVARLLVNCLDTPGLAYTTFEVSAPESERAATVQLSDRAGCLEKDVVENRPYASFPFVPKAAAAVQ